MPAEGEGVGARPLEAHIGFGAFGSVDAIAAKAVEARPFRGWASFDRHRSRRGKNGPLSGPATQSGALFWALIAERFPRPTISEPPKLLNGERWVGAVAFRCDCVRVAQDLHGSL